MSAAFAGLFGLIAGLVYLGFFVFVIMMMFRLVKAAERIADALERK